MMRGSDLLVTVQIRGMIKEEEKRNRSPLVLIFGGGGESICERKARRERKNREAQQNQGELESRGGGFHTKRLSFTYERKKKKEQKKSSFSPPGRSVKPHQRLAWQRGSSPRHRLTMEVILGRHTSHFQSGSSGTGRRARGPRGGMTMLLKKYFNSYYRKKKLYVARIGLTSKK